MTDQASPFAGLKPEKVVAPQPAKPTGEPKQKRPYSERAPEAAQEVADDAMRHVLGIEYYDWLHG